MNRADPPDWLVYLLMAGGIGLFIDFALGSPAIAAGYLVIFLVLTAVIIQYMRMGRFA
jgi:hypothetical protein